MAISKETEEWLAGLEKEGGIPGSLSLELRQHLSHAKADEFVRGSVLRQADYSRNSAETQRIKAEVEAMQGALEAREAANQAWATELVQWKEGAQGNYEKALAEREKAETKAAKAIGRLKSRAAELGLNEEELIAELDMANPNPQTTQTPPPDTSNFISRTEVQQTARDAAMLDGIVNDLADEHNDLFGTRLNRTALIQEAFSKGGGKSLRQYWEEKYSVGAKQKENAEKVIDARIAEAVAKREAELRSTLPGQVIPREFDRQNPMNAHKIFSNKTIMDENAKNHEAGNGVSGVSAAVAAFAAGKYHGK